MTAKRFVKITLILLVILINIGCDQVSKKIIRQNITPNETIHLLSRHITITNVENTGAFLSLGNSLPKTSKNILLSLLPFMAVMLGLLYVLTKKNLPNPMLAGFCFVIGGGIGNIFDRSVYGSVTDFLHVDFGIFQTGIFNMADLSIMTGVFILLIQSFLRRNRSSCLT
jgi:signal peptidase II